MKELFVTNLVPLQFSDILESICCCCPPTEPLDQLHVVRFEDKNGDRFWLPTCKGHYQVVAEYLIELGVEVINRQEFKCSSLIM